MNRILDHPPRPTRPDMGTCPVGAPPAAWQGPEIRRSVQPPNQPRRALGGTAFQADRGRLGYIRPRCLRASPAGPRRRSFSPSTIRLKRASTIAEIRTAQIESNMYYLPKLDPKDPFAHLREIKQPTFILNGVNDVMIPTINSWSMAQNIPNAQLFVYPDAGHAAQFQYPERFLKHAIQFLSE